MASPEFVAPAAVTAWSEDAHAAERREIFRRKRDRFIDLLVQQADRTVLGIQTLLQYVKSPDPALAQRLAAWRAAQTDGVAEAVDQEGDA